MCMGMSYSFYFLNLFSDIFCCKCPTLKFDIFKNYIYIYILIRKEKASY